MLKQHSTIRFFIAIWIFSPAVRSYSFNCTAICVHLNVKYINDNAIQTSMIWEEKFEPLSKDEDEIIICLENNLIAANNEINKL